MSQGYIVFMASHPPFYRSPTRRMAAPEPVLLLSSSHLGSLSRSLWMRTNVPRQGQRFSLAISRACTLSSLPKSWPHQAKKWVQ